MLIVAGAAITFNSCKKEQVQPQNLSAVESTNPNRSVSNGSLKADNVGEAHNALLEAYFAAKYDRISQANFETQTVIADNFFCNELEQSFHKNYYCSDIASAKAEHIAYEKITAQTDVNNYLAQFDFQLQRLSNVNGTDVLSASAKQLMAEYRTALFQSKTIAEVLNKIDILEANFNTKTTSKTDEELIKGIISITRASAEFWSRPGNNDGGQRGPIGDGVGFLAGWGSSVWSEIWSNGSLCECNSSHRLGQGVIWGAAGSIDSGPL